MKTKAFTLVELMVVIAIIAILAVGSITSYGSYLKKARLSKALQFSAQIGKSMPTQLKGWWDFNEGTGSTVSGFDNSGNGSANNITWSDDSPYPEGGSIEFNGTNGYVLVSEQANYLNDRMTVSAWIKPEEPGTNGYGSAGYFLSSLRYSGNFVNRHDGVRCRVQDVRIICDVYSADNTVTGTGVNSSPLIVTIGEVPEFNEWMHVAFSLGGDTGKLYINGDLVGESTVPGRTFRLTDNTFTIGRYDYQGNLYYKGLIDEVRVYHDAIPNN